MADPADIGPAHQCPTCFAWGPAEVCQRCEADLSATAEEEPPRVEEVAFPVTINGIDLDELNRGTFATVDRLAHPEPTVTIESLQDTMRKLGFPTVPTLGGVPLPFGCPWQTFVLPRTRYLKGGPPMAPPGKPDRDE